MGIMDDIDQSVGYGGGGAYATADERMTMVSQRTPFYITGPLRTRDNDRFDPGNPKKEWMVEIELMDWDGQQLQSMWVDDGEGGQTKLTRTLTLAANAFRDPRMTKLEEVRQRMGGAVGPLKLVKEAIPGGTGQPPYHFKDWTPADAAPRDPFRGPGGSRSNQPQNHVVAPPAPPPPPPPPPVAPPPPPPPPVPPQQVSPDGNYGWDGQQWRPIATFGGAAVPPPPPFPPAYQPYQPLETTPVPRPIPAQQLMPGHSGEEFQAPLASDVPPPGTVQPLPEGREVRGPDGEGGMVSTTQYGPAREAHYLGDGVVRQPTGIDTQNVVPSDEDRAAEEAAREARGRGRGRRANPAADVALGPPQPPETPAPPPAPMQQPVTLSAKCPTCEMTVKGVAFPARGKYVLSHVCEALAGDPPKKIGLQPLDVDAQARQLLAVAGS